jgi:hypothetical protein
VKKTILIAGGASAVSLAIGAASGYLIAKKRFEASLPELLDNETKAIKKFYAVQLMEAKSGKPDSPADIPVTEDDGDGEEAEEVLTEADQTIIDNASRALTDYQGISTQGVNDTTNDLGIPKNVFDQDKAKKAKGKKALPPRDDQGHFRKRTVREEEHEPPQLIDSEAFLLNDPDHGQESLLYFVNDKTLVLEADASEPVDINLAGEVNLTLFPKVPEGEQSVIYVRNDAMSTDYEIKRMTESLTEYIGLGEYEGDDPDDDAAYV